MKTVTVTFALPGRQWSWRLALADHATVGDALAAARAVAREIEVPWNGPVGIFGASCDHRAVPHDGDRIEIYRPLRADPKETRRARAQARKAGPGPAAARPEPRSKS